MMEVAAALLSTHAMVWGPEVLKPPMGMPFLLAAAACAWTLRLLPAETYAHDLPSMHDLVALAFLVDLSQMAVHAASHAAPWLRASHALHHRATRPCPKDAFATGWIDAFTQMICPLFTSLWIVKPSRTTAMLFGLLYSHWLVYLHSDWPDHPVRFLVTPSGHKSHHARPDTHLSHIFRCA
tara:strand:- start:8604 stop:9146 length:543 start_codon:yes stop_codon:yes gene_type:complete